MPHPPTREACTPQTATDAYGWMTSPFKTANQNVHEGSLERGSDLPSVTAGETVLPTMHSTLIDFVTIDTETGGLFPSIHALLAIGATCSWSTSTFEAYITPESQPGKMIDPEAVAKNGYSLEAWELLKAQPIQQVYPVFAAWLLERKKERPGCVFVCHHLAFDKPFLSEAGRVCGGEDLPGRHSWRCSQVLFGLLMDIGILAEGKTSLNRLIEVSLWPVERYEQHNALQDAFATQHGFTWLLHHLQKRRAA